MPEVDPATCRVVLLGASNLSRGLATVLTLCRRGLDASGLEVLAAHGWGRSYGTGSWVLGRSLPSILHCGLWRRLSDGPRAPAVALLTDVGNDLAYGVPPARVAEWVGECLARLHASGARTVVTGLPVDRLAALKPWRFHLFRLLYFPRHRISRSDLLRRLAAVDDLLRQQANRWGAVRVEMRAEWYGVDPIHLSRRRQETAWSRILAPWLETGSVRTLEPAPVGRWRLLLAEPERWWLLGVERRGTQPALCWQPSGSLWLY